jgi:hypothetical protein
MHQKAIAVARKTALIFNTRPMRAFGGRSEGEKYTHQRKRGPSNAIGR